MEIPSPSSSSSTMVPSTSSRKKPLSSMDPQLYLYAATSEGRLDREFASALNSQLTPQNNTALHIAAKYGQTERVKEFHRRCPSLLRCPNSNGDTALHVAARNGFLDIVRFLIDQEKQRTSLFQQEDIEVGRRGNTEVAETDQESSLIRLTNKKKDTALHVAVRSHFLFDGQKETQYLEVVKLLIEADPKFEYLANEAGETPMYIAAEDGLYKFVLQLLQADSSSSSSSTYGGPLGRTALHVAVYDRQLDMAKKLLEKKPDLMREADKDGWTPLHFAVDEGCLEMVKLLLEYDRSVAYLPNKEGNSPIHLAAQKRNSSIFHELMLQCPDCHELVNNQGRNALHFVITSSVSQPTLLTKILGDDLLEAKKASSFPLLDEILKDNILQAMTNEVDYDGNTALHLALEQNNHSMAAAILQYRMADRWAMNAHYITPHDIILKKNPFLEMEAKWRKWKKMSRMRTVGDGVVESADPKVEDENKSEPKNKGSDDPNLVVATLIATVTFAAGFTMPGGFNSSSPNPDSGATTNMTTVPAAAQMFNSSSPGRPGTAVLSQDPAFQVFVLTNAMAMVFAVSAVFLHFWANLRREDPSRYVRVIKQLRYPLIFLAFIFMVIAFMAGSYAVLPTLPSFRLVMITAFLYQPSNPPYQILGTNACAIGFYFFCCVWLCLSELFVSKFLLPLRKHRIKRKVLRAISLDPKINGTGQ